MSLAANQTNTASSSRLMTKLHDRHLETLHAFHQSVRDTCQQLDVEEVEVMTDLRTSLTVNRSRAEQMIQDAEDRLAAGRQAWAAEQKAFQERAVGDTVSLMTDVFHKDGVASMDSCDGFIYNERAAVLQMYVQLRVMHGERASLIDATSNVLAELEGSRRVKLRRAMETLMHDLSVIAYLGVTESQVVVQRAVASVNEQLVGNQRTCKTLISQLKQHEILKQRDYAERTAVLFQATLAFAQDSCVLWTQQLFASKAFRAPKSRVSMLKRIQAAFTDTKGEVEHALEGMSTVVGTLRRIRNPTEALETCGGTESNGWLRFFNEDIFKPIFSESPVLVANEWRVFIEVILHNAQCSVVTLTEDTETIESQLLAEMGRIVDLVAQTVERLHTPTDDEIQWIKDGSLDGEHLYPFQNYVVLDVVGIDEGKRHAMDSLQTICAEIADESAWFKRNVAQRLQTQKALLDDALVRGQGNVIRTFSDATIALKNATEAPMSHIRTFYVTQYENRKDYEDQLSWLERDVADITHRLEHAGTVDAAQALCIEGMKRLEDIERLYVRYHKQRVGPMPTVITASERILEEESNELFTKLNVVPKQPDGSAAAQGSGGESPTHKVTKKLSKLSSSTLQAVTVVDPHNPTIALSDGSVFHVMGPIKFGAEPLVTNKPPTANPNGVDGSDAAGQPSQGSISPRTNTEKEGKGKPPAPKGKAGGAVKGGAPSPVSNDSPGLDDAPPPPESPSALRLKFFVSRMDPIFEDVFPDGCMFNDSTIDGLKQALRGSMLEWTVQLKQRVLNSIRTFCDLNKKALDRQMNECVRRHQRRAPTLQAQTYESRLRELHDGNTSRAKYFEWLSGRVDVLSANAAQHRTACNGLFEGDCAAIRSTVTTVGQIMSGAALDSHGRSIAEAIRQAQGRIRQRQEEGAKQVRHMAASILQECTLYRAERLKSFEEGGSMAKEEVQAAADHITATMANTEAATAACVKELEALSAEHDAALEAMRAAYDVEKIRNADELAFFASVQEVLAQLKGRVTNQLSVSLNAQRSIDEALAELEALIASAPPRTDAGALASKYLSTDYDASFGAIERRIQDVSVPTDWGGYDETLASRLIQTHLSAASLTRHSLPTKVFATLETLRRSVVLRGLFLGCLAYGVEYVPIYPDAMVEPRRESSSNNNAQQQASGPAGNDAKKLPPQKGPKNAAAPPPPAGSKGASTPPGGEASPPQPDVVAPPQGLPAVVKAEVEVMKWATACREQLQLLLSAYFQKRAPPLLRTQVLGTTAEDVNVTVAQRVTEQERRSAEHVVESIRKYREQVQRLFVAIHGCAAVICSGLFNLSIESLCMRLDDIFRVFDKYYATMHAAKHSNSALVKGTLSLPPNRPALDALHATEETRQRQCKTLLQTFQSVVLRELQDEAGRVSMRVCHSTTTLFTLLKGVVCPEHVQPGEGIISGQHKGLKRLMRQRMREEAARVLEGAPVGGVAAKGAKDAKKPEPKKSADKLPPGKKGAKGGDAQPAKDAEDELPLLDRQLIDYPGVALNSVKVFTTFRQEHGAVIPMPRNHYVRPAQWEAEKQAAQQAAEAELQASDPAAKKAAPKAAAAKPSAKTAASSAPQNTGGGGLDEDLSPVITGPRDRLHQQAVLLRQTSIEAFATLCSRMGSESKRVFQKLEGQEAEWNQSWLDVVDSLRTEKQR